MADGSEKRPQTKMFWSVSTKNKVIEAANYRSNIYRSNIYGGK